MKVALCLFGLVGGTTGKNARGEELDPSITYRYYKKYILDKNNIDIYFHTWSCNKREQLLDLYKPKKYIFQPQLIFSTDNEYKQRAYSRWYSTQKVINLIEGNYDFIMLSRFDVVFLNYILFKNYNPKYFYASHFNDINKRNHYKDGFSDLWFFGGMKIMKKFGQLYDFIEDYTLWQHGAAKQHLLTITKNIRYKMWRGEDFELTRKIINFKKY